MSTEPRPPANAGAASPDAYLALVAEHITDLVALLDHDAKIVYASPSYERTVGCPPNGLVGTSLFARLHPADLASMLEQWRQFTTSGAIQLTCRLQDVAGAWRWLNLAIRGVDGAELLVAVAQDVTERRQAEQLLARLLRHNDLTLNAIGEGVFGVDPHGNATFVNAAAARMLGWEALQLLGRPIHAFVSSIGDPTRPPADESATILSTAREGRVHRVAEARFWRSDGASFPVDYVCTPVVQSGEVVGAVVVFRDLTERKALEAQFLHAQKMESIGKLASGIAHDFNNLLTGIVGYASMAAMFAEPDGPLLESLQEIEKSGFRAADLTRQLLAFARKQPLNPRLMLLNDLLLDTDKLIRRLVGSEVQVMLQLGGDLAPVRADPGQMSQVIINLAVNARDAMPSGGTLTLQTANVVVDGADVRHEQLAPGPYVCLSVRDTGVGIPAEVQPRLFEPFFTTKAPGEGTGLGLATSYGIVQQHRGTILVASAPGQGATFEIYLPQAELGDEPLGPAPTYDLAPPRGSERILVAEDDDTVRRLVVSLLREAGYTVRDAADGETALQAAHDAAAPFDLLLTDIVLPRLRGPALASRVAALAPSTRVLYTSGHVDDALVQHGQLAPGVQFLPKPFSAADLLRKVRQVLDG